MLKPYKANLPRIFRDYRLRFAESLERCAQDFGECEDSRTRNSTSAYLMERATAIREASARGSDSILDPWASIHLSEEARKKWLPRARRLLDRIPNVRARLLTLTVPPVASHLAPSVVKLIHGALAAIQRRSVPVDLMWSLDSTTGRWSASCRGSCKRPIERGHLARRCPTSTCTHRKLRHFPFDELCLGGVYRIEIKGCRGSPGMVYIHVHLLALGRFIHRGWISDAWHAITSRLIARGPLVGLRAPWVIDIRSRVLKSKAVRKPTLVLNPTTWKMEEQIDYRDDLERMLTYVLAPIPRLHRGDITRAIASCLSQRLHLSGSWGALRATRRVAGRGSASRSAS